MASSPVLKVRRRRKKAAPVQLHLDLLRWGGARPGAGRPRTSRRVRHEARPALSLHHPVHVTWRLCSDLAPLRCDHVFAAICEAIGGLQGRHGASIFELSLQNDHLHALAEALGRESLARGLHGVGIALARALHRAVGCSGPVFADRYHIEVITSPRQMRNALTYVLNNRRKHHSPNLPPLGPDWIDPFSTAPWFEGWSRPVTSERIVERSPCAAPRTWLARTGWRRHGLIDPATTPGPRAPHGAAEALIPSVARVVREEAAEYVAVLRPRPLLLAAG